MKTQVEALRQHRYGGKLKRKGDKYTISEAGDLRLFKALRWVSEAHDSAPAPEPIQIPEYSYLTRALTAEKPKRKYTRRKVQE